MSACMSEFKKMFKFATNLNHKVVSSSTMDIYDLNMCAQISNNTKPPPIYNNKISFVLFPTS